MPTPFRVHALPRERFASLFLLGDADLAARGARRIVVDEKPGFPCRVSLADADVGETVLLLPFTHHDVASPYRASGPIFVRQGAPTACPAIDEIPEMLRHRLLSVRGYDRGALMVGTDVVHGRDLEGSLSRLLGREDVAYVHVHNAGPGCYNCRVERA